MLVTAIQQNGEVEESFKPEVVKSSICSKRTIEDIKGALHDVVWDKHLGTAAYRQWSRKAQSDLVSIAGKTGTAQLIINGRYTSGRHRMTFVGYFPEENPQYTCICMIEDPRPAGTYDAGMDCGSVVRIIAEKTMAYTGCYVYRDGERVLEKR
jgi:cell division protein FtsI (penicillin-binding protein 3)